jgi:hypothetical protein
MNSSISKVVNGRNLGIHDDEATTPPKLFQAWCNAAGK